ncbi:hypothetical protein ABZT26_02645 [Streptomyces sp. NPDC005395]|uniref:hypothetical protein n=1 Tax=unclassified Streptomyces TaxID=2593676 RepID=UPI001F30865C|nr:hypothetical protein [Streptomyces sp. BSE6.1]
MDAAAEDDAERARNRAKLYQPPGGYRRGDRWRARPPGVGVDMARAQQLTAQLAAEDARLEGRRGG